MSVYIFNLLNYYFFYNFYILLKLYEWIVNSDDEAEKCSLIVLGHLCCHPATRVIFFPAACQLTSHGFATGST